MNICQMHPNYSTYIYIINIHIINGMCLNFGLQPGSSDKPPLDRPPRCVSSKAGWKGGHRAGHFHPQRDLSWKRVGRRTFDEGGRAECGSEGAWHLGTVAWEGEFHGREVMVEVGGGLYYTQFRRSDNRTPINGNFPSIKGGGCPIYTHLFLGHL